MAHEKSVMTEAAQVFESYRAKLAVCCSFQSRFLNQTEKEEAQAECMAYAWQWIVRAVELGKVSELTPGTIALFAGKMFRSGRRFAGGTWNKGASLNQCYAKEDGHAAEMAPMVEALACPRALSPDEATRIKVDYAIAEKRMNARQRALWLELALDRTHGTQKRFAEAHGLSNGRVSQLKGEIGKKLAEIGYGPRSS